MKSNIPQTIGVIMDGNRRFAKKNGKLPWSGHKEGFSKLEELVEWVAEAKIKNVIVYAFSTENWNRSKKEVSEIMNLLIVGLTKKISELVERGARVSFIGNRSHFSKTTQKLINDAEKNKPKKERVHLIIALSYGGKDELVRTTQELVKNRIPITEESISKTLDTKNIPDPDLIIRTGGEMRLSNFLLWQSTYSELFFTNTLWPDFSKKEFLKILDEFKQRERRNGK